MEPSPLYPEQADDELLGQVWEVERACRLLVAPDEPFFDRAERIAYLRDPPATEQRWLWIVGRVDGYARLMLAPGSGSAWLELFVAPSARRRGYGRALLAAATAQARAAGARHVLGQYGDATGAGFVAAVGARIGTDRLRSSVLRLPLATPPVPDVPGYTRVSWTGATPENLLESYALARNAINDAPHDDAIDDERYTPERVRALEADAAQRGREIQVTVALDGAGVVAGFTEVRAGPPPAPNGFTDDTAVLAAHRGRGLATWIKDGSLRRLAVHRPDVAQVVTWNDLTNAAMLAVNDRLGFVTTCVRTEAIVDL